MVLSYHPHTIAFQSTAGGYPVSAYVLLKQRTDLLVLRGRQLDQLGDGTSPSRDDNYFALSLSWGLSSFPRFRCFLTLLFDDVMSADLLISVLHHPAEITF